MPKTDNRIIGPNPITTAQLDAEAANWGVPRAALEAVAYVEADYPRRRGLYPSDGFPVLLFERHKFYRFTGGKGVKLGAAICSPKAGGYTGTEAGERGRLRAAMRFDRDAALMSASWGLFQIMGFNHAAAGFPNPQAMLDAFYRNEQAHLVAFLCVLDSWNLIPVLKAGQWTTFAKRYNGPAYAKNNYHRKLAAAYRRFSAPTKGGSME